MKPAPPVTSTLTINRSSCLPANPDFGVVADHEAVRGRLHRQAVNADVASDQAVLDAVREVADHAAFQHDAVLDLRVANLGARPDRAERADVGVDDARLGADDGGSADDRPLDHRAGLDHDLALD